MDSDMTDAERDVAREARRCLYFSAKDLRHTEGPDSVLADLVEEEECVLKLDAVLGGETADEIYSHGLPYD